MKCCESKAFVIKILMEKRMVFFIFSLLMGNAHAHGQLFLIGGGKRVPELLKAIIKMADQKQGRILLVPLASEIPAEVSEAVKTELVNEKAKSVDVYLCDTKNVDEKKCLEQINQADLIFFTGGDQNRLLKAFENSQALELIKHRHENENLALAGTSAGTAIMSEVMITGNPLPPFETFDGIRPGMVETTNGFGFVKKYIIDQHFLKRGRQNRLISAVLEKPYLIGLGIDESTGILIESNDSFQVFGESTVTVIDARQASIRVDNHGNFQTNDLKIELKGKVF